MDHYEIISYLLSLERHFEDGRQKAYSIRKHLEQLSAPAPSGEGDDPSHIKLVQMLNKRRQTFYKKKKG
jgi:hypothetical protein